MIPILVAGLMWLLVASLLILRRGRPERSITYSALAIAVAMTLNIDPVYVAIDAALGGTNLVTMFADVLLMVGIFFLGRAIARATDFTSRTIRLALGRTVLAIALGGVVVSFFLIDRGATTTNFMLDVGAQPAAAAYSIIQFTYDGIVVATMAVVAWRQAAAARGGARLPALLILIGSVCGLALSLTVITMDVAHVAGNLDLMSAVSWAYAPLFLATFVFLCLGLAGQPMLRWMWGRTRERRTRQLIRELAPVWRRATDQRPGLSQRHEADVAGDDREIELHRQVVEIRDAVMDPRVGFELSDRESSLVDDAEAHLLGVDTRAGERRVRTTGESRAAH